MLQASTVVASGKGGTGDSHQAPASGASLHELMQPTRRRLALLLLLASYIWAMSVFLLRHPRTDWLSLLPPICLLAAAVTSLSLPGRSQMASVVPVAGMTLALMLELASGRTGTAGWLAVAATLFAGVLLGPWGAVPVVIGAWAASLWLHPGSAAWSVIRDAGLALALVWASGDEILHALIRLEESEARAWRYAGEAMERRGELQQTSKALRDMYALLERTNRELEVARREAEEAREVKARFTANISHELRTPLNLILGFSRMMYRSPEVYGEVRWTPELRADVREIHQASRHLLGMIDDILDLSRIEAVRLPLTLEPSQMETIVEEAASTARGLLRGSPVSLEVTVSEDLPELMVDRTRIRQVLLNLLSNAIRFTDSGRITVEVRSGDGEVEALVADTGVGIPAEDLLGIFDEFSQAGGPITSGRGGAGLGLAVCKGFVEMHGGRITAESRVGKGTTFRFTIPVPGAGRSRSRLVYYSPAGWLPPLPENPMVRCALVLAPDQEAARLVARGIEGFRTIPVTGLDQLREVVEAEHPTGVVLVTDPLAGGTVTPDQVWSAAGREDLGLVECQMPVESLARRNLQVDAYLSKPVDMERLAGLLRDQEQPHGTILVVDDDPGFRALMERLLAGVLPDSRTHLAASGEEALECLTRRRFDVLILDLAMPSMAGAELLRQARERELLDGTRVVVTTGAAYADEMAAELPVMLTYRKKRSPRGTDWSRCLTALLAAAPPDYSLPAGGSGRREDPGRQPAS